MLDLEALEELYKYYGAIAASSSALTSNYSAFSLPSPATYAMVPIPVHSSTSYQAPSYQAQSYQVQPYQAQSYQPPSLFTAGTSSMFGSPYSGTSFIPVIPVIPVYPNQMMNYYSSGYPQYESLPFQSCSVF